MLTKVRKATILDTIFNDLYFFTQLCDKNEEPADVSIEKCHVSSITEEE